MQRFGLIGFPVSHSFSQAYFTEKFSNLGLSESHCYELFPLRRIEELPGLLKSHPDLRGLNVTIPYKEAVIAYLSQLSAEAKAIGAVNTIRVDGNRLIGYNTDTAGFGIGLDELLNQRSNPSVKALILGTGGAAKAVCWALDQRRIPWQLVSRSAGPNRRQYHEIDRALLREHRLVINTTPLGMYPKVENAPPLPYEELTCDHLLFDLVYNPEETLFLKAGRRCGAAVQNGLSMLHGQADKAWEIWSADL